MKIKKFIESINLDEFVFDIVALISVVLSSIIIKILGDSLLNIYFATAGVLMFYFAIAFQSGANFAKLWYGFSEGWRPWLLVITFILLLGVAGSSFAPVIVLSEISEEFDVDFIISVSAIIGIPLLIISFFAGFIIARKSFSHFIKIFNIFLYVIYIIAILIFSIGFRALIDPAQSGEFIKINAAPWVLTGITFLGIYIFVVIGFFIFIKFAKYLSKQATKIPKKTTKTINLIFIGILAIMIVQWTNVLELGIKMGANNEAPLLMFLVLIGILPFRFLFAITPPRKTRNIVIAIISMLILTFNLFVVYSISMTTF